MNLKELKDILQLLDEKEITEFELEEEGMKLRVRKAPLASNHSAPSASASEAGATPISAPVLTAPVLVPSVVPAPAASADRSAAPASAPEPEVAEGQVLVRSPIVGTFYRASDPNSPPFVSVGDRVRVGQVLCIIEAMKLMNEIEAEVAGVVEKIHHENGQPIQYGDPLFAIRPER